MKKSLLILLLPLILILSANAQVPQGIPYQAVARNGQGEPLASTNVKVRFSILDSTAIGTAVYVEAHSTTTSALGLFSANVGTGTASSGTFSSINWGQNYKFLKVELDTTATGNSYIDLGTQQLMSVPYALYAGKAISTLVSRMQIFTASGTFVVPANVYSLTVEVWGAGGGGGGGGGEMGGYYGSSGGGGASGGCYRKVFINVSPGQAIPVAIGIGGVGGVSGSTYVNGGPGQAGQPSSFGAFVTALGGNPGGGGTSRCSSCGSGYAGLSNCNAASGSVGPSNLQAGSGGNGGASGGGGGTGGYGGSGGSNGTSPCNGFSGNSGEMPGGGGGGGGGAGPWSNVGVNAIGGVGGVGGNGLVCVYW